MNFDPSDTAVVVIDPQNDVLSPSGKNWEVLQASVTENNTVGHLVEILTAAKARGFGLFVSRTDAFTRRGPLTLVNFAFLAHAVLSTDDVIAAMTVPTGGST